MKRTLLSMVQDILSALDSDEVNSIDDTIESTQIANILKNTYLNMASNKNWYGHKKLITFDHSGTTEKPTHLKSPENIKELHVFNYNKTKVDGGIEYHPVKFLEPDSFLRRAGSLPHQPSHTKVVTDFGGTPIVVITNKAPSYWTTFDDEYIICDSYDSEVDDALKASKSQLHVTLLPTFNLVDDFVPELPAEAFSALFNEAKSVAFVELKQVANQKAEQEAVRQRAWLSRKDWQLQGGIKTANYGRRSVK